MCLRKRCIQLRCLPRQQYNGTPQIKNGWITKHTPASGSGNSGNSGNSGSGNSGSGSTTPATLADALAAAAKLANDTYLDYVTTITGKISKIESYNATYNSYYMYVNVDGTEVYCYSLTEKDGKALAEGDTVTVSGKLTAYNGTPQFTYKDSSTTVTLVTDGGGKSPAEEESSAPAVTAPTAVDPVAGTGYKLFLNQANRNEILYLTGNMNGYYYETTTDASQAAVIYVENDSAGGIYLYFMKDGAKTYLDIIQNGTYTNVVFVTAPSKAFTYHSDFKGVSTNVEGTEYYLGTFNNYNTISASKMSYIEGDKASTIDVSNFIMHFTLA